MVISAVLFSTSALGCALSADFAQLVVYRIIGGVGIGVVSIVSPLYISELAVAQYRGRLVSLYQLAVTVGFLGAYLVNYQLLAWAESGTQLSVDWLNKIFITEVWRGMLGMETLPAILFFIIIFFIPESPRWLIVRGKELKAVNILEKIYNSITEAKSQLNETKSVLTSETKSEWSLLMKPGIFKAVIIGVCIAILGQFMGVNAVLYYGPSIFENAGLSGGDLADWVKKKFGWILEVVLRPDECPSKFQVLPKRWIVERSFSWLENFRRLTIDYEFLAETAEAMVQIAFIQIMLNKFIE